MKENSSTFNFLEDQMKDVIKNQVTIRRKNSLEEKSSIFKTKMQLKNTIVDVPLKDYKSNILSLEKELFSNLNLEWGVDIISEDIPLIDINTNKYYCHLIRTANPDPNKDNFLLIHGFITSGLHFFALIPYLIKRYNVFIPDTIGMGLSCRPKIKFTSPKQTEEFFISTYHIIIEDIFFNNKYNIKKEYFFCGHSLGGFIASRYMLKYPKGIKKVLLLSPVGITDHRIPGTNTNSDMSCCCYSLSVIAPTCLWPCRIRAQDLYRNCCFHNCIKKIYRFHDFNLDEDEIKKNKEGAKFTLNEKKIEEILSNLAIISLEYPDDLYDCIYYIFTLPPPATYLPIESSLMHFNTIDIVFVYGKDDFMDKFGAYRLHQFDPDKYKIFTTKKGGHSFTYESPKELYSIFEEFF